MLCISTAIALHPPGALSNCSITRPWHSHGRHAHPRCPRMRTDFCRSCLVRRCTAHSGALGVLGMAARVQVFTAHPGRHAWGGEVRLRCGVYVERELLPPRWAVAAGCQLRWPSSGPSYRANMCRHTRLLYSFVLRLRRVCANIPSHSFRRSKLPSPDSAFAQHAHIRSLAVRMLGDTLRSASGRRGGGGSVSGDTRPRRWQAAPSGSCCGAQAALLHPARLARLPCRAPAHVGMALVRVGRRVRAPRERADPLRCRLLSCKQAW